jgi:hypothetical protein
MNNLKDKLSNICGIILAICTALVTTTASGISLPTWLITACGILIAISGAIIGVLTGKAPDGSTKTPRQITEQLKK